MRVVLAGGGTAGHIFPTLSVARRLHSLLGDKNTDLMIVCGSRQLDVELYRDIEFDLFPINVRGLVGVSLWKLPGRLWGLTAATIAIWREVCRRPPDVIIASGGYISVPVLIAGWVRRIPRIIFSGDAQLGWATRALAPLADVATVAFPDPMTQLRWTRVEMTGYPLRSTFANTDPQAGRRQVGIKEDDALVLVVGGSQGAHAINTAVERALSQLLKHAVVVHVAGRSDVNWLTTTRKRLPWSLRERYHVHEFVGDGFANLMAAADLIVTRSGATSVAELGAVGTPAVIVPGTFGAGHQIATAEAVAAAGAAVVLREAEMEEGKLAPTVIGLLDNAGHLAQMRTAAAARGQPDAAGTVASIAIKLVDPDWEPAAA